jgi:hypothetical protein
MRRRLSSGLERFFRGYLVTTLGPEGCSFRISVEVAQASRFPSMLAARNVREARSGRKDIYALYSAMSC